jgi:hypothetical protein
MDFIVISILRTDNDKTMNIGFWQSVPLSRCRDENFARLPTPLAARDELDHGRCRSPGCPSASASGGSGSAGF